MKRETSTPVVKAYRGLDVYTVCQKGATVGLLLLETSLNAVRLQKPFTNRLNGKFFNKIVNEYLTVPQGCRYTTL